MKTYTLPLICLLILSASLASYSQDFEPLQFELGKSIKIPHGVATPSTIFLSGEIKTRYQDFDFGFKIEHGIFSLGSRGISRQGYGIGDRYIHEGYRRQNHYLDGITFWAAGINYSPKLKNTHPIFGLYYEHYPSRKIDVQIFDLDYIPTETRFRNYETINRFALKLGYNFRNFRIYHFYHFKQDYEFHIPAISFHLAYNFNAGMFRKNKNTAVPSPKETVRKNTILRFDAGLRLGAPVAKNYDALGISIFYDLMFNVKDDYYIGLALALSRIESFRGYDKKSIVPPLESGNENFTPAENIMSDIGSFKFYLSKNLSPDQKYDLLIGGGFGYYYTTSSYRLDQFQTVGLFTSVKLTHGIFSNNLEFNLPIGNIPFYVGLKLGIGFQLKKTQK